MNFQFYSPPQQIQNLNRMQKTQFNRRLFTTLILIYIEI